MLCQECNENEAKVHVSKIINNQKYDMYLCEKCAQNKGELDFGFDFSFDDLLTGLLNNKLSPKHKLDLSSEQIECDNCGLTHKEFSRKGKLGCKICYETFSNKLDNILKRIQGSKQHVGKAPKRGGKEIRIKRKIQQLKKDIDQAIKTEEFEKAAEIRDQIKDLERKLNNDVSSE